jgi:teichuronic acid biosynthesis glycosyltransferase TuaG
MKISYKTNLVSIIMPAYNSSRFIGEAIQSVLEQDYQLWELIIVDDGSTDDTSKIVYEFSVKDSRVCLYNQINSGPALARQNALLHARGRYIAFLDSDDKWIKNKLSSQLNFMAVNNVFFSYTSFRRINFYGLKVGSPIRIPDFLDYNKLLRQTAIATSTVLLDRSNLVPFRFTITVADDFVLWLDILKSNDIVARGLQMDLMRYRLVKNSVSRNKFKSVYTVWNTYRNVLGFGFYDSLINFFCYAYHAIIKYRRF